MASLSLWSETNVFTLDAVDALLHAPLSTASAARSRTARGTTQYSLVELLELAVRTEQLGSARRFVRSIQPRDPNRWDVALTDEWVTRMAEVNVAFRKATQLVEGARAMAPKCRNATAEWHAMLVRPGSPDQPLHIDDTRAAAGSKRCFYTFLMPLQAENERAGATVFPRGSGADDLVFYRVGDALLFDGAIAHYGRGNRSAHDRIFLYAALFTGRDANAA